MSNPSRRPMMQRRAPQGWLLGGSLLSAWLLSALLLYARTGFAADSWGGSVSASSDYLVRGISRTDDHAALQFDFHYANTSGLIAGLFASNSQMYPGESEDVELSPFIGFAWTVSDDWRTQVLAAHYSYPWNRAGSRYDYDEMDFEAEYKGWLNAGFTYSPNMPYLSRNAYQLHSAASESAQIALQHRLVGKLMGNAGVGYAYLAGPNAVGYGYWSVGLNYDLRPFTLAATYVGTTSQPEVLFYGTSGAGRWTGTVIWRF
jgi:uncharacterized protein (TIGR02001 family)